MPATLDRTADLTQLDSIKPRPAKALINVDPHKNPEILRLIGEALRRVGLSQKEAAINAGVKEQQFSAALLGQGNFGAMWLWAQPDTFWREFLGLIEQSRGLTPEASRAMKAARIAELVRLLVEEVA